MLAELTHTVTIAEAARRSGVHVNSIRNWIDRGHVQAVATPYGRAIVRESLEEFLQRRAGEQREAVSR